jgi:hypothetical protein
MEHRDQLLDECGSSVTAKTVPASGWKSNDANAVNPDTSTNTCPNFDALYIINGRLVQAFVTMSELSGAKPELFTYRQPVWEFKDEENRALGGVNLRS